MIKYINKRNDNNIMKRFSLIFIFILCVFSSFGAEIIIENNVSSLGGKQVESDNVLFIDFSNTATRLIFGVILVILILSFLVIIHPVNSFLLMFFSVMLMANGFNLLISFIVMLISIMLINASSKK